MAPEPDEDARPTGGSAGTSAATTTGSSIERPRPTDPDARIVELDVLRGFALLGILAVNVWFFSMPSAAAELPSVYGNFTGANYAAWFVGHVFFQLKFLTLFTILFGAGIVLFTERKERAGVRAVALHDRRLVLLLGIGLGHAYLLWYGDILVAYALCGLLAVRARHLSPRSLASLGLALLAVHTLLFLSLGLVTVTMSADDVDVLASVEADVEAELEAYRGGWLDQMNHRVPTAFTYQTVVFGLLTVWRVTGLMLLGMALFRWGVLSNDRSTRFYRRVLIGGAVAGLVPILAGVWYRHATGWGLVETVYVASQFNYWGSLPLAGAYVAGIMLLCRRRPSGPVTGPLAAVGRTAFSNYLLQTILATTIFYGHGLGLFGAVSRVEQVGIVLGIWAIQLPLSVLWLRYFRYGPVEWIWRTATYGEAGPFRRR